MSASIEVAEADITQLDVDAIANAANTQLMHGGGVAGAIARAGGQAVVRESQANAPIGLGEAVETTGGDMPCRWVIHAATMELGGPTSSDVIRRATASTLRRADELGARSLALVAFGTGVGGFPLDEAARIEVSEVRKHLEGESGLERIVFAVRGAEARRRSSGRWRTERGGGRRAATCRNSHFSPEYHRFVRSNTTVMFDLTFRSGWRRIVRLNRSSTVVAEFLDSRGGGPRQSWRAVLDSRGGRSSTVVAAPS